MHSNVHLLGTEHHNRFFHRPEPAPGQEQPKLQPGGPRTIYIKDPWAVRCILVGFFLLPYAFFHWAYYSFIVDSGLFGIVHFSDTGIWVSCGMFFANHLYSFIAYNYRLPQGSMDIVGQIFLPYRRIIPVHMTIIFGGILLLNGGNRYSVNTTGPRPLPCPQNVVGCSWPY